jgi:hypothetical protein
MTGIERLMQALGDALKIYDWPAADALTQQIVELIHQTGKDFPEEAATRVLKELRASRRFDCLTMAAEALLRSGHATALVRRQYAQALIDRNILYAPELVLHGNIHDLSTPPEELTEAHGLTGRIYKQLYVNLRTPSTARKRFLERAIGEYLSTYRLAPNENLWPGINAVALLMRAQRDRVSLDLPGLPDPKGLANEILVTLQERKAQATGKVPAWDIATELEALVALGRYSEVVPKALEYILREDTKAFKVSSTLRQFEEVWELTDKKTPGSELLPILHAAQLKQQGGHATIVPEKIVPELKRLEQVTSDAPDGGPVRRELERVYGEDGTQTLAWYAKGLEQAKSVAQIERLDQKGHGTAWLVDRSDFFGGDSKQKLLVTNSHVISPNGYPGALAPDEARARFAVTQEEFDLGEVVWSSPPGKTGLDVTFVSFRGPEPSAPPLRIYPHKVRVQKPAKPVYVIGHPGGRGIEFSLRDNALVCCHDRELHYRAPTEHGSSGSPVFEDVDWRVIALHHAGKPQAAEESENGTAEPACAAEANEGISILAIQQATKNP